MAETGTLQASHRVRVLRQKKQQWNKVDDLSERYPNRSVTTLMLSPPVKVVLRPAVEAEEEACSPPAVATGLSGSVGHGARYRRWFDGSPTRTGT